LVRAYANETDGAVWTDIAKNLGDIATVWAAEPNYGDFKNYTRELFLPIGRRLGWVKKEGENDLDTLLRPTVLSKLAGSGDEETVAEGKRRFAEFLKDPNSLPADLKACVYTMVVSNGDKNDWEAVQKIYLESTLQEEKVRALRALGLPRDKDLILRALEFALSKDVRSQDLFIVFAASAAFSTGREVTWQFLKDKIDVIENIFGKGSFMLLARTISYTVGGFSSEEKAKEVEEFFAKHPIEPAKRAIDQGLESIRSQALWLQRDRESVAHWLKQFHK